MYPPFPPAPLNRALSTSGQLVCAPDSHATATSQDCDSLAEDISHIRISLAPPCTTITHQCTCTALPSSLPRTPTKTSLPSSLPSSISASLPPHSPTCSHPSPTIKHLDLLYDVSRPEVIKAARIGMRSSNGGGGSGTTTSEQYDFSSNGGGGSGTNTSEQYDFSSELFWRNSYSSSSAVYCCTNNCPDALYDAICYGAVSTD
eukprot:gene880-5710_t